MENGLCFIRNNEYTLSTSKDANVFYFYRNDRQEIEIEEVRHAIDNVKKLYEIYVNYYLGSKLQDGFELCVRDTDDESIYKVTVEK